MTKSRVIGRTRVRPQVINGAPTGKWFVDVPATLTSDGKRRRKLFDNVRQATEVARELHKRIDPVTGAVLVREKPSGATLPEAITGWLADERMRVQTLKKRASTLEVDQHRLKAALKFFGAAPLHLITEQRLCEYQAHRLALGRKPVTINCELITLGLVLNWAVKRKLLRAAPKVEQIPVRPAQAIIPTPEEVVRIIDALPPRLKPVVRFLAETGCRRGEALNLTWESVDELGGYVEIAARDGWTPKTQQSERRIPLSKGMLDELRALPKTGAYVFPGRNPEKPLGSFKRAWAKAVEQAAITRRGKPVHLPVKSLRKAHATWQAERGVTESVLQGLLGHARGSRVTKQFYVHATEEAKRAAVITLPLGKRTGNGAA